MSFPSAFVLKNNPCFLTPIIPLPKPKPRSTRKMVLVASSSSNSSAASHNQNQRQSSSSVFSLTSSIGGDFDYLGQRTKGDFNLNSHYLDSFASDGHLTVEGPIEEVASVEAEEAENFLKDLGIPVLCTHPLEKTIHTQSGTTLIV